jgi:DNA-binding XRE family transcriptional regulator
MDSGKSHAMPLHALEQAEDWNPEAKPTAAKIIHDGYAAVVEFDTGVKIDFPSDFVLHVCEPSYAYYKDKGSAEQRAEEEAIHSQHAANPVRERPAVAINRQSFAAILSLVARFKAVRESQGLTLAEVAERMGIDAPALSRLETGKMLNPTLATLHKWAEALGQKMDVDLSSA